MESSVATTSVVPSLFASPPRPYQPKFRWWWPHGLVDTNEIRREIDAMADAGFGGAEIADVHHSIRRDLSSATHGWGTAPWRAGVEAALDQARKRGLSIDHSIGPSWPASSCLITPDSEGACKELATGVATLEGGQRFDDAVPPPPPSNSNAQPSLIALQAVPIADGQTGKGKEIRLQANGLIDLLPFVSSNRLQWTAPSGGSWIVISYWLRGSGQQPEGGPHTEPASFVVDHFSAAGSQAIVDLWDDRALTPRIRRLMKNVGGNIFEDSIEMETRETIWTPRLIDEFEKRRGYSLLPYLPLVVQKKEDPIFEFADFDSAPIRHDWWQTLSELFLENHFVFLRDWAQSLGLGFRGQPYGLRTDAIRAAATLDIAEGESLGFKNLDDYRSLAGGRDMGGRKILSNEAGAYPGSAYSTTWKRILQTLNPQFAAGVNQTVLHGFAYATAPGVEWPGFAAFTPYGGHAGYSEAWGPRQPCWRQIRTISDYFARIHFLLQQGQPQVDVAFLRQKGYAGSGFGAPWFSKEGAHSGWTLEFISPATLQLPSATVRDGLLAPDGPAYQLLVFEGDAFNKRAETMELPAARKLLELAKGGLRILIVGDWTAPTTPGLGSAEANQELQAIFAEMTELPTVAKVGDRSEIVVGIQKLNIRPRLAYELPNGSLVNAQRLSGTDRFFYLCNESKSDELSTHVELDARLAGQRFFALDLWSGKLSRIDPQPMSNERISIPVTIPPNSATAFVTTDQDWPAEPLQPLPSGKQAIELRDWTLSLDDWRPGDSPTQTLVKHESRNMPKPTPWSEIEGLQNVSGVGVYATELSLDAAAANAPSLALLVESAFDLYAVRVNGQPLPSINPYSHFVPLAGFVKQGRNTIEIECPSTLINRLRVSDPDVYGSTQPQIYGLAGSVRIRW